MRRRLTITHPKTQEMNTFNLFRCLKNLNNLNKLDEPSTNKLFFVGCNSQISKAIFEEFILGSSS